MFPTDFLKDSDIPKGSAVFKHHENILAIKYRAAKNNSDGNPKVVHFTFNKTQCCNEKYFQNRS